VNDQREGKVTRYFPKGTKEFDGQFKAGKKDGAWTYYDEDSADVLRIETYKNDVLIKKTIKKVVPPKGAKKSK
jgi:antitoxin component YwqK of YwqJK toxin-antitoxin module